MWELLKKSVRETNQPVHNERQLINILKLSWEQIPQETVRHLVESMTSRLQECIDKRGGIPDTETKRKKEKHV